jgi:plastocyanin
LRTRSLLATGLGALAISALGFGCGSDEAEPATTAAEGPAGAANEVTAVDFAFEPDTTEIEAGDAVTWTNDGATIHNVKGKGFFSEAIDPGESYQHTFTKPGTYEYLCNLHPDQMRATVEVTG